MLFNLKLLPLFVPKTNNTIKSGIKSFPRPVLFAVRCYAYVKVCSVKKDIPSIVKYLCFEELQTKRSCWSFLVQFAPLELTRLGRSHVAGVCGTVREYSVAVPCERSVWMLVESFGGRGGGGGGGSEICALLSLSVLRRER